MTQERENDESIFLEMEQKIDKINKEKNQRATKLKEINNIENVEKKDIENLFAIAAKYYDRERIDRIAEGSQRLFRRNDIDPEYYENFFSEFPNDFDDETEKIYETISYLMERERSICEIQNQLFPQGKRLFRKLKEITACALLDGEDRYD